MIQEKCIKCQLANKNAQKGHEKNLEFNVANASKGSINTSTRSLWNQYEIGIDKPYVPIGSSESSMDQICSLVPFVGPLMKVIPYGTTCILFKFEPVLSKQIVSIP